MFTFLSIGPLSDNYSHYVVIETFFSNTHKATYRDVFVNPTSPVFSNIIQLLYYYPTHLVTKLH